MKRIVWPVCSFDFDIFDHWMVSNCPGNDFEEHDPVGAGWWPFWFWTYSWLLDVVGTPCNFKRLPRSSSIFLVRVMMGTGYTRNLGGLFLVLKASEMISTSNNQSFHHLKICCARPVCRHHMEGNCTYGSQCRFSHSCFLDRQRIHKPGKFGKNSKSASHMGIHRNHAENKVSAGIFRSFLLFAAHVSGRETKSIRTLAN